MRLLPHLTEPFPHGIILAADVAQRTSKKHCPKGAVLFATPLFVRDYKKTFQGKGLRHVREDTEPLAGLSAVKQCSVKGQGNGHNGHTQRAQSTGHPEVSHLCWGPHTAGLKQLRGKKARPFFPRFCDGPQVLLNASLRWRLAGDDARSRISVYHKPRDAGKPPSMALTVAVFFGLT